MTQKIIPVLGFFPDKPISTLMTPSTDGEYYAQVINGNQIMLVEFETKKILHRFEALTCEINQLILFGPFTPDETVFLLAIDEADTLYHWTFLILPKSIGIVEACKPLQNVAYSGVHLRNDEPVLIVIHYDGKFTQYSTLTQVMTYAFQLEVGIQPKKEIDVLCADIDNTIFILWRTNENISYFSQSDTLIPVQCAFPFIFDVIPQKIFNLYLMKYNHEIYILLVFKDDNCKVTLASVHQQPKTYEIPENPLSITCCDFKNIAANSYILAMGCTNGNLNIVEFVENSDKKNLSLQYTVDNKRIAIPIRSPSAIPVKSVILRQHKKHFDCVLINTYGDSWTYHLDTNLDDDDTINLPTLTRHLSSDIVNNRLFIYSDCYENTDELISYSFSDVYHGGDELYNFIFCAAVKKIILSEKEYILIVNYNAEGKINISVKHQHEGEILERSYPFQLDRFIPQCCAIANMKDIATQTVTPVFFMLDSGNTLRTLKLNFDLLTPKILSLYLEQFTVNTLPSSTQKSSLSVSAMSATIITSKIPSSIVITIFGYSNGDVYCYAKEKPIELERSAHFPARHTKAVTCCLLVEIELEPKLLIITGGQDKQLRIHTWAGNPIATITLKAIPVSLTYEDMTLYVVLHTGNVEIFKSTHSAFTSFFVLKEYLPLVKAPTTRCTVNPTILSGLQSMKLRSRFKKKSSSQAIVPYQKWCVPCQRFMPIPHSHLAKY